MIARLRDRAAQEEGVSLVELLVVMVFMGVIGTLMLTTLSTSTRAYGQVDDEARGLADLQTVVERLSRDLRAGRGIEDPANQTRLTIWIDRNSDYARSDDEIVTWRIEAGLDDAGVQTGQYDVVRETKSGERQVIGYSLVSDIAFSYSTPAPVDAKLVTVSMDYDAIVSGYASARTATFDIRLRNAP